MKDFLNWFDRRVAKLEQDRENFDTEVARYKVVNRFSYGWDDPTSALWMYPAKLINKPGQGRPLRVVLPPGRPLPETRR